MSYINKLINNIRDIIKNFKHNKNNEKNLVYF